MTKPRNPHKNHNMATARVNDFVLAEIETLAEKTDQPKSAVIRQAIVKGLPKIKETIEKKEKIMNINKISAREAAHALYRGLPGPVRIYGDPETGLIELLLVDQWPSEGYEYLHTDQEGVIQDGQELAETEEEIEQGFALWWDSWGDEWIGELEELTETLK